MSLIRFFALIDKHPFIKFSALMAGAFTADWYGAVEFAKTGGKADITLNALDKIKQDYAECQKRYPSESSNKALIGPRATKKIVLVDTSDTSKAYSESVKNNGQTNAHFLRDALNSFKTEEGVVVQMELIGRDQSDLKVVSDDKPNLVVVHRSAFSPEDHNAADAGIVSLIGRLLADVKVLIYSKKRNRQ